MKESWDFNVAERSSVLSNSEIVEEKDLDKQESTECPYDLEKPYQANTPDSLVAGSKEAYKNFFDAIKKGYLKYKREEDEWLTLDFDPLPREFFGDELVHVMSLENYQILDDDDYLGDNQDNGGVYLQTSDSVVMPNEDVFREGRTIVRLVVDTDVLFAKGRKIYIDDESITETPEEFEKSFFMYGGIPKSAIKKMQVIRIKKPDLLEEDRTDYGEGAFKQREKEYHRRLQSLRAKI
jgi:hypothetical protein